MGALLAEHLAAARSVDLIHHHAGLSLGQLRDFTGHPLDGVGLRYIEKSQPDSFDLNIHRWRQAKAWRREATEGYESSVVLTHQVPPFCQARTGVLFVLFPFTNTRADWPWVSSGPPSLRARARRLYFDWEWRRRLDTYRVRLSISEFTRRWTRDWWGIDTDVLHPPVDITVPDARKTRRIVTVGRFVPGSRKHQLELVQAAGELNRVCEGSIGSGDDELAYLAQIRDAARGLPVRTETNVSRRELTRLSAEASIVWHAAGLGADESTKPQDAEHFGIAVVEAMAAGCVPVVARRGAMPEIVSHGESGFLCDTFADFVTYTRLLLADQNLLERMQHAARARASFFALPAFNARFDRLVAPDF
jgi:glycosyltransferase involved in cell wall biosynthesis